MFKKKKAKNLDEMLAAINKANAKVDRIKAGLDKTVEKKVAVLKRIA